MALLETDASSKISTQFWIFMVFNSGRFFFSWNGSTKYFRTRYSSFSWAQYFSTYCSQSRLACMISPNTQGWWYYLQLQGQKWTDGEVKGHTCGQTLVSGGTWIFLLSISWPSILSTPLFLVRRPYAIRGKKVILFLLTENRSINPTTPEWEIKVQWFFFFTLFRTWFQVAQKNK